VTLEFLEGPIARDYRDVLEAAFTYEAKVRPTGGKACKTGSGCNVPTGGKGCKTGSGCDDVPTGGKACKTGSGCNVPTGGKNCKSDKRACPKAHALHSSVPGWSLPPASPVA
jgi:hypothetical protein